MIRTCSKCGAYYADAQLAFCLADGTPLVDVDPGSEKWNEGSRSILEKANTLRRQRRRRWWQRIAWGAMTMVLMALVVSKSFTVETTKPSPVFYKISGRVISASRPLGGVKVTLEGLNPTSTTTDANGYYTFSELRAGGEYTITPRAQTSFNPSNKSFNDLRRDESADFVAIVKVTDVKVTEEKHPPAGCSASERKRLGASLIARFAPQWRRNIEQERSRITARTFGVDVQNAVATLGPIKFQPAFTMCSAGVITARYAWQVKADLPQGLKTVTVPGMKTFACGKVRGVWICH
jgi:hypothetical protein